MTPEASADAAFLGREWVFKELHQTVLAEMAPVTVVRGAQGSGKSAILRQLVLHSPLFLGKVGAGGRAPPPRQGSNADTVDSGIVAGRAASEGGLSSRNYEWMRTVAERVAAFHECSLQAAPSCAVPEFVRGLASYLLAAPALPAYAELLEREPALLELVRSEAAALRMPALELARRLLVRPLGALAESGRHPDALLLLVDAVDEAEFHRNENGESIAWLVRRLRAELPNWVRWVLSAAADSAPFSGAEARSLFIDDTELDERVNRDMRLLADFLLSSSPRLDVRDAACASTQLAEEIVRKARGNALYINLLAELIEQGLIQLHSMAVHLLPDGLPQLYLLCCNCVFRWVLCGAALSSPFSLIAHPLPPHLFLLQLAAPVPLGVRGAERGHGLAAAAALRPAAADPEQRPAGESVDGQRAGEQVSAAQAGAEPAPRLLLLRPFARKLSSGAYAQAHTSVRDWLLHGNDHTDYLVNVR